MPFKDPERKTASMKDWRSTRSPEYHKWLYDRRAFRFWKAEKFEEVLEIIATGKQVETTSPAEVAAMWLYEARRRELEVGLFFDHDKNVPANQPSRTGGTKKNARKHEDVEDEVI